MNPELVKQRFVELANSDQRSKMARFRQVFSDVQAAIDAGATRAMARDLLAELGLDISYKTFTIYLDRVRIEQKSGTTPNTHDTTSKEPLHQTLTTVETAANTPTVKTTVRAPVSPALSQLPDDWLTCTPTRALNDLLTPEQKIARNKARDALFDPSPYDLPLPIRKNA